MTPRKTYRKRRSRLGMLAGLAMLVGLVATSQTLANEGPGNEKQPILISKTATGTYDARHSWTIEKLVKSNPDGAYSHSASLSLGDGSSGSVTWRISAADVPSNTNFHVAGTITVSNTTDKAIEGVTVYDAGAFVVCPGDEKTGSPVVTVPANDGKVDGTVTCTYTADPDTQVATNTATASWNTGTTWCDEKDEKCDPKQGTPSSVSATVNVAWSPNDKGDIDGSAWVEDTNKFDFDNPITKSTLWTYDERWTCAKGNPSPNAGHSNTATITWGDKKQNSDQDSASVSVTCGTTPTTPTPPTVVSPPAPSVDIQVKKTGLTVNQDITWTVVVKNNGPDTANAVKVTEPIPSGLAIISGPSLSQGTWNATAGIWDVGQLLNGQSATFTVVTSAGAAGGTFTNAVIATAGNETGPKDNNVASASATVPAASFTPPTPPKKKPPRKPAVKQEICAIVAIGQKSVSAGKASDVKVMVTRGGKPLAGAVVRFNGAGVNKTGTTGANGIALVSITAPKSGIITVSIVGKKTCSAQRLGVVGSFLPPVTG
jgi:uncharacterized repeat protein (TIGR01451 family)